jgi:hypothetical protein
MEVECMVAYTCFEIIATKIVNKNLNPEPRRSTDNKTSKTDIKL